MADKEVPVDYEIDEEGNVTTGPEVKPSWLTAFVDRLNTEVDDRTRNAGLQQDPLQKAKNDAAFEQMRIKAQMAAMPVAMKLQQSVPGAETAYRAIEGRVGPPVRQPIQMQREFSSEEEKKAYLQRKAQEAIQKAGK